MNTVILLGRLTKDPDVRLTQAGKMVCLFTLAVDTGYGEKKQTAFIPIVVWGNVGEACGNHLSKGSKALVDGRINMRSYDNRDGKKVYVTEVIASAVEFLDGKPNSKPDNGPDTACQDNDVPF
jgi:single-strand DNA-binding protein